jgi:hypothetical protein
LKTYKITLTQKIKIEAEAETPQAALQQAKSQVEGRKFEPDNYSVKEV